MAQVLALDIGGEGYPAQLRDLARLPPQPMHDPPLAGDRETLAKRWQGVGLASPGNGERRTAQMAHAIEQPVLETPCDLERAHELEIGRGFTAARLQHLRQREPRHHLEERR